jgi:hypothetical protein
MTVWKRRPTPVAFILFLALKNSLFASDLEAPRS